MNFFLKLLCSIVFLVFSVPTQAQIVVKDAWARATIASQRTTGVYFQIQSSKDAKLVAVNTKSAEMAEIHEMKMHDDVMTMREVESINLPANTLVELKPKSFHIMLMGLKAPAKQGDEIEINLVIEGLEKKREIVQVKAKVRSVK